MKNTPYQGKPLIKGNLVYKEMSCIRPIPCKGKALIKGNPLIRYIREIPYKQGTPVYKETPL